MSLEDTIRMLAREGNLTHLTLCPTDGGKKWQAAWAGAKKANGYAIAVEADPSNALVEVFKQRDLTRKRKVEDAGDEFV